MSNNFQQWNNYDPEKRHPGCFQLWMVAMILFSILAAILWLDQRLLAILPPLAVYAVVGTTIAEAVCVFGIFQWKKWGVYGLVAALIFSFILKSTLNLVESRSIISMIVAFVILYFFVPPKWKYYT